MPSGNEGEVVTFTITTFLDAVEDIFEAAVGLVGDVANLIANEPILLAFVALPLVGLGVGLFKRLIRVN